MPDALELDLAALSARERYSLLNSVVVPRPIAWVCTVDAAGLANLAPFSYFNLCSLTPPIVHFTAISSRDSIANVRSGGQFVVNVVTEELAAAMRRSSAAAPGSGGGPAEREDEAAEPWLELSRAGVSALPSSAVRPPRLAEAKVALECGVLEISQVGEGTIVFGEVLRAHVHSSLLRDGEVDPVRLRPVGRLGGAHYATITEVHALE